MKKKLLVTILASTLALGASAISAGEVTTTTTVTKTTTTTKTTTDTKDSSKHKSKKSTAHNSKHHGKKQAGKSNMMKRIAKKLDLTDEQTSALKALRKESKAASEPLRKQMKALYKESKALDTTSADYDTHIAALADKKASLARQTFILKSVARQKFEAVLTAEQLTKLKELKKHSKMKGKKQHSSHEKMQDKKKHHDHDKMNKGE